MAPITKPLIVHIPDTRGVKVSQYGLGNLKIGLGVYTYSRLPGRPSKAALGMTNACSTTDERTEYTGVPNGYEFRGTCPASSPECEEICYAARPVEEMGVVSTMWLKNSATSEVPPIPEDAKLLRLHVSGDFDTIEYVKNWITRLIERPDVVMWAYTRSWRVPELLPHLEILRGLPNVTLWASMDQSIAALPPVGWRRAWIDGDARGGDPQLTKAHMDNPVVHNLVAYDGTASYVCPEETKRQPNCEACKYCFKGETKDVMFLRH